MKLSGTRAYVSPTPMAKMPTGLVELMEGLSREVLKHNPSDIFSFCAEYMRKLLELRDGNLPNKCLNLDQKISLAKNIIRQRAEQRRVNYDIMEIYTQTNLTEAQLYEKKNCENVKGGKEVVSESQFNEKALYEQIKSDNSKLDNGDKSDVEIMLTFEKPMKTDVFRTIKECGQHRPEVKSNDNMNGVDSNIVFKTEANTDVLFESNKDTDDFATTVSDNLKNYNKIEVANVEDTFHFTNSTGEKINIDEDIKINTDNKFNKKFDICNTLSHIENKVDAEICEIVNFELTLNNTEILTISNSETGAENIEEMDGDKNRNEYCISFISTHNNLYGRNIKENIIEYNSEIIKKIAQFETVNEEENTTLPDKNVVTETISPSIDTFVKVHSIIKGAEEKPDYINASVMVSEEVHNVAILERTDESLMCEEATKSDLIVPHQKKKIEGECVEEAMPYEKIDKVEENSIKSDLFSINSGTDLRINVKESRAPMEFNVMENDIRDVSSDSYLSYTKEQTIPNFDIHYNIISSDSNELKTEVCNIKDELREDPLIKNNESVNVNDSNNKMGYSQNNITEYCTNDVNSDKQLFVTKNTKNLNKIDLEKAAITIQKVFRNFLFRTKTSSFDDSAGTEFIVFGRDLDTKNGDAFEIINQNLKKERRAVGISRMDTVLQTVNEEKSLSLSTDDSSTISSAATIIQAHIRGFLVRNRWSHNKTLSNASLADCEDSSAFSFEADSDPNKNKGFLNIHIVPEGGQFMSRDESLLTSVELSLDGSPPTSANLHPLGYNKNERRKQLKREDAIQSISPPSINSRLSDENDSVKEKPNNETKIKMEQTINIDKSDNTQIIKATIGNSIAPRETDVEEYPLNRNSKSAELECKQAEISSDEADVVTPFIPVDDKDNYSNNSKLLHSGEFHDLILPTKVSRSDTEVVSDMPLPPALAARLAKRGIIKTANVNSTNIQVPVQANEEIIAEDYDSKPEEHCSKEQFWEGIEGVNVDPIKGHRGCPNKSNIYHECSKFCVKTWKQGKLVPNEIYLENKKKALELWPLPPGWEEVYDEGTGQHYFWNVHNNLVSWLPPAHPQAVPSESAAHLREEKLLKEGDESDDSSEASDQEVPQQQIKEKRHERKEKNREMVHHRDKKRQRVNDLDPMDPASYSDIPRGNWTSGLDAHAKTGVDTTASGSLYQMRPYPAPGAILAANAKQKSPSPSP